MLFPIAPKHIDGSDTHAYYNGMFTEEEIDKILALPEWICTNTASVGGARKEMVIAPSIRKSKTAWVSPNKETFFIWERISEIAAQINSKFFHFDLSGFYEPLQLSIYDSEDEGHYTWHQDSMYTDKVAPRKLSLSLTLSHDHEYEGGELQILNSQAQEVTLETNRGKAWFFPAYTLHRVTPVTKGVRRSLVVWIGGPQFK